MVKWERTKELYNKFLLIKKSFKNLKDNNKCSFCSMTNQTNHINLQSSFTYLLNQDVQILRRVSKTILYLLLNQLDSSISLVMAL